LLVTICTADTIGTIRSLRLFQILFDSGSNDSKIKRSALPKGVITKVLGDTKLVKTLAECIKMQEVITIQDLIRVIAHPNGETGDGFVADKTGLVWDHKVGSPSVCDCKSSIEKMNNRQERELLEELLKGR
jgi:hypothetical protein